MTSSFQAAALVAAPLYPNAVVWSDENLIAVASGHLNPALPYGPRGLITIRTNDPYPIGLIPNRQDLLTACLLPISLSRDCTTPCVRSISWSPLGMAPNSGCLLAVCTLDGRVKLYCPPFCDFRAEWIEIMDISDMLYNHLTNINFGESDISNSLQLSNEQAIAGESLNDHTNTGSKREHKRRKASATGYNGSKTKTSWDLVPCSGNNSDTAAESKSKKKRPQTSNDTLPQITAKQYAFRSSMLHSVVVAWSPVLRVSSKSQNGPKNNRYSILAVGGKSGKISIWRVHVPQCYSIEQRGSPPTVDLVGLLDGHTSWVTAMSWYLLPCDGSPQQILLVTGSSDGSVKIWMAQSEELLRSSDGKSAPFSLLKEVIPVNIIPVSVLSDVVPSDSPHKMLLAIGKGSGSIEIWKCDVSGSKFDKADSHDAHSQVVTGLAWALNGHCLYSTSLDNFVRSWILRGNSLVEVTLPSNTPGLRSSTDLPDNFISSVGMAVSPGNLVLAMVRSYDHAMLDQMVQKAAVEFLWIGGQLLDTSSENSPEFDIKDFPGFSGTELVYWESNILQSLQQYEYQDNKPLVIWDIVAALLAFKQSIPKFIENILLKWLSVSYCKSTHTLSAENILSNLLKNLSKISSRQLQILNIICRRVLLSELKSDQSNSNKAVVGEFKEKQTSIWKELVLSSEKELRERLVWLSFSFYNGRGCRPASQSSEQCWHPVGLAQMEQWVASNSDNVHEQLKVLASTVQTLDKRKIFSSSYVPEEQCSLCSASVPFNSPEVAFCQGSAEGKKDREACKLERCAFSMQICPMSPLWFCKCCSRRAFKLPPETLFTMLGFPSNSVSASAESQFREILSKPLCPFCGVLLQRLQPEFLLSASPV
ncbi:hypothetical protein ACFE04_000473 [Oxalis oulophora]